MPPSRPAALFLPLWLLFAATAVPCCALFLLGTPGDARTSEHIVLKRGQPAPDRPRRAVTGPIAGEVSLPTVPVLAAAAAAAAVALIAFLALLRASPWATWGALAAGVAVLALLISIAVVRGTVRYVDLRLISLVTLWSGWAMVAAVATIVASLRLPPNRAALAAGLLPLATVVVWLITHRRP